MPFGVYAFLKAFLCHLPIACRSVFGYVKEGGIVGVQFFLGLSAFLITRVQWRNEQN
jgi:peptidoglycan/LPS O-acetylase OafA/YrhL